MKKSTLYAAYDMYDDGLVICIGTAKEVAKRIGRTPRRVRQCARRGVKLSKRYRIDRVGKGDDY